VSNPYRVGITGGIGSGKSAVTEQLQARGITVIDADIVAREVVEPGSAALRAIAGRFGGEILRPDGTLDRAALRQIVFRDPRERKWLEQLTHPLIGARIREQLAGADSAYVVLSSPLLLETSQRDFVDHVVVVDVPESTQRTRTMARDNNTAELVQAIIDAQMPRKQRLAGADSVLDNSGDLTALAAQVDQLHEALMKLANSQRGT
jgi:dephospho-CoA kinase